MTVSLFTSAPCKCQKSIVFGLSVTSRRCWCLFFCASVSMYAVYDYCIQCVYLYAPFCTFQFPSLLSLHLLCFSKSLETFLCVHYRQDLGLLFSLSLLTLVSLFSQQDIPPLLFPFFTEIIKVISKDPSIPRNTGTVDRP